MKALPEKFEERTRTLLGDEFQNFLSSLQDQPPVSIRRHPLKNPNRSAALPVAWSRLGEYLERRPVFTLDPLFHAGSYYVQEASSMFLEQVITNTVDLTTPLRVLDLCAAPGGKSTHLLSLISRESLLVSNEVIRSRALILAENIQKWGYPNTIVSNNDPADFQRLEGFFDVLLVDAPCSGEGLFRKDPHAMAEWSPENVQLCCSRQKRIVADAWPALKQDGILIYCTCTYNESENEENLTWLKERHGVEFLNVPVDPSWGVQQVIRDGIVGYRFFPHRLKGEGFFISAMRKTESTASVLVKNKTGLVKPAGKTQERLGEWILPDRRAALFQFQDLIFYLPEETAKDAEFILQHLRITYAGTNLARLKHDKLIPEHALALSAELNGKHFPTAAVPETEALKYLRKDAIQLEGMSPGFTLLTYQSLPLGWVNVLGNRVNNMYPPEWRIRMDALR